MKHPSSFIREISCPAIQLHEFRENSVRGEPGNRAHCAFLVVFPRSQLESAEGEQEFGDTRHRIVDAPNLACACSCRRDSLDIASESLNRTTNSHKVLAKGWGFTRLLARAEGILTRRRHHIIDMRLNARRKASELMLQNRDRDSIS